MIAFLKGTIAEAFPSRVLMEVQGVGYEEIGRAHV